jgi:hypothetical protein
MSTADVPEQVIETTFRCARHPGTETVLRCGRCETPICPKCMIGTPVGARCPTCARVKRFATILKPRELATAIGLGLATAAAGSLLVGMIPFLGLIGLAVLGFGVGEVVSIGANRKRARELAPIAVACLVLGFALGPVLGALLAGRFDVLPLTPVIVANGLSGITRSPQLLIGLGVGALLAWMRVRVR